MGLKDFTPATETVAYPDGNFAVRGLSLEDLTVLVRAHYKPLSELFDRYVGEAAAAAADEVSGGQLKLGDVSDVVLEVLETAPGLLADVISRAAGEPDQAHMARMLPTSTQIDAIEKVIRLTLEAEGGLEKLVGTVSKLGSSLSILAADRSR